jgi:hypothetical protein
VGALALSTTFRGNRVGAAVKYVDQRTGSLHDGAPSLDLGLARDVSRYTVGVAVQNIGDGIHFKYGAAGSAALPLRVTAGVTSYGWGVGPLDVNGSAELRAARRNRASAFGLEFGYVPLEDTTPPASAASSGHATSGIEPAPASIGLRSALPGRTG